MKEKKSILSFEFWIIVSSLIICLSGSSAIQKVRTPLFVFLGLLMLIKYVHRKRFSRTFLLWIIWLILIVCVSFFSYDLENSWRYIFLYFVGILLIESDFSISKMSMVVSVIRIVSLIIAFSVICAYLFPNFMNTFWFTVSINKGAALTRIYREQILVKAFSGFAGERSEAAFIINMGIASLAANTKGTNYLCKKNIFYLVVYIFALFLTGKRTLLLISILQIILANSMIDTKKGSIKVIGFAILCTVILLVAIEYVPAIQHTLDRFNISEGSDVTNGRAELWDYSKMMFNERPLIGCGLGSYNEYAFLKGYRYHGVRWNYHNHCIYIQAYAEMGFLIASFWIMLLIQSVIVAFKTIKKSSDEKGIAMFSLSIEILILLYGLTGNTLYYDNQLFTFFMAITFIQSIRKYQRQII